jgi:penicillin-binding protein 2
VALGRHIHDRGASADVRTRLMLLIWLVSAAFLVLIGRLYTLQIMRGQELSDKGKKNYVQEVRIPHDRGIVYDRHGRILVDNRPSLDVYVTPHFLGKRAEAENTLKALQSIVQLEYEDFFRIQQFVLSRRGLDRFRSVLFKRDISSEELAAVEAERSLFHFDGVEVVEGRRRIYTHKTRAAHVLGYVNEIDAGTLETEKQKGNPLGYVAGDLIGRDGIERSYEPSLRGVDGYEKTVVDAKGRKQEGLYVDAVLGDMRRIEPQPGYNVYLTLDIDLQEAAEAALIKAEAKAASVVALDPHTGAVLAMVSMPEYDPNLVSGALARDEKRRLDTDMLKPWLNRPIQGLFAPGSTFKVITSLAALRAGFHENVGCAGSFHLGRHVWRCHKDEGHGRVDLHDALKLSCDTYFYTVANRIGIDAIADVGRTLGLGHRTGIGLRGEKVGNMPDEAFHNKVDKSTGGYQRGMAINTSIGQGALQVTPLQMAVVYAAIADGKHVYKPQLVHRIETSDFRVLTRYLDNAYAEVPQLIEQVEGIPPKQVSGFTPEVAATLDIPEAMMQKVREGLTAVVQEPGGTAYSKRSPMVTIAGKTGTAQVVRLGKERLKVEQMSYLERDHAWFVAYASAEAPELVVAVLNEHSGHGGSHAAPVAVAVIEAYFRLKKMRQDFGSVVW